MIDTSKFFTAWSPRVLSIARAIVSVIFMEHGGQKLFGMFSNPPFPSPPLFSLMWTAGVLEFFGGALLLLGLFVRPVAFVLMVEMIVAYTMAHAPHGFWPIVNHGELALIYASFFLSFVGLGGGAWSIDSLLRRRKSPGVTTDTSKTG